MIQNFVLLALPSRIRVRHRLLAAASLVACLCVTGCGGQGNGGNTGGDSAPAGPIALPNTPCSPAAHNEGCALGAGVSARLRCNAGTETWQFLEQCPASKTCTWVADPADPTGSKKLAVCGAPLPRGGADTFVGADTSVPDSGGGAGLADAGSADAGSSSGGAVDVAAAKDVGGVNDDCGNNVCDSGENETSCAIDCQKDVAEKFKCIAGKCEDSYKACMAQQGCRLLVQCIAGCKDDTCTSTCAKGINAQTAKAYQKLGGCIAQAKCDGSAPETKCGDLKCEGKENDINCPQDCKQGPTCGDGKCEGAENANNCASDCKAIVKCGDLICTPPTETLVSCALDCDVQIKAAAACLKQKCEAKLDSCTNDAYCMVGLLCAYQCPLGDQNCLQECGKKTASGQILFNALTSCALLNDCKIGSPPKCGNGKCEQGEDKVSCAQDCGACATACINKECGTLKDCNNKVCGGCGAGLKCENNVCVKGEPICGDGSCDGKETAQSCSKDCGGVAAVCGNGKCELGETASNCAKDCNQQSQCDCKAKGATCGLLPGCKNNCGSCQTTQKCTNNKCVAASTCGNKVCEKPYEDASSCPLDCDNSQSANCNVSCTGRCGKYDKACKCQCDSLCHQWNDCCADKVQLCGK